MLLGMAAFSILRIEGENVSYNEDLILIRNPKIISIFNNLIALQLGPIHLPKEGLYESVFHGID